MRGSPIRKSSDQRSVDSSPRLIAASYVLHRLLVPRHPPCALNNLATQKTPHNHPRKETTVRAYKNSANQSQKDARVHCAVLNHQPVTRPPDPTQPRRSHRNPSGMRDRPAPEQESFRSLRTQQRAYAPTSPVHHVPRSRHASRTSDDQRGRPNWSVFHPRAPPQVRAARRG